MKIYIGDIETNGLEPTQIWCVVLKEFKGDYYYVFVNDDFFSSIDPDVAQTRTSVRVAPLSSLQEFIDVNKKESTDRKDGASVRIVFHNGIDYDCHWLKQLLNIDLYGMGIDIRDTYILSKLANPRRQGGHSVGAWGERFGLSKTSIEDEQWSTFDPIMLTRCITDVDIQEKVYDHLRSKELNGFSLKSVDLEHETQKIISQMRRDGVYLAPERVHNLYVTCKNRADSLENEIVSVFKPRSKLIREYNPKEKKDGTWALNTIGQGMVPGDIGGNYSLIHFEPFNPSSPSQRVERLLELGWVPTEFTKPSKTHPNGQPKFTEDSLASLSADSPEEIRLIGKYLMTRSRQALTNELLNIQGTDGYIHGYIDPLGAKTHRFSSNSPNLQNIPKPNGVLRGEEGSYGWECRNLFCVKDPNNYTFVDTDAKGIQLRGLAHYSGDSEYISLVSDPSVDIHDTHASVLGCSRPVAKTFIYAYLMGGGKKKLISILGNGDSLEALFKRFPFLKEFKKRLDKDVERGYHVALDGRLIRLSYEKPHLAMSVALQSYEAIIMKTAMCLYHKDLQEKGIWFKQRLIIHDEYLTETKKEYAQVVGEAMVKGIVDAGILLDSKCPVTGNSSIGPSWSDVH